MLAQTPTTDSLCILDRYTPVWEMGTGVPTSLPPGSYRITGQQTIAGVDYWVLNQTFRVDSRRAVSNW